MRVEAGTIDRRHLGTTLGVVDEDPVPELLIRTIRRLERDRQAVFDDVALDRAQSRAACAPFVWW
jgi:hypothetical protein